MRKLLILCFFLMSSVLLIGCTKQEVDEEPIQIYSYEEDQDSYVLESDDIKFVLDPTTTYFTVHDKSNGSTWTSNPEDGANDPMADATSLKYLQSTLLLEYTDERGIKTLYNNYQYSILLGAYQISQNGDTIQVDYSIGDLQKIYYIPTAAPESRMNEFTENMDSSGQRQIKSYYRKVDINNLRPTESKSELLAQYPDLENEIVYVLRDGIQEYLLRKIEEIFAGAGYTIEDYEEDLKRYEGKEEDEKPHFNISVFYSLDGNDLVVEVPYENMEWRDAYKLTKLRVLPYLGAGSTEDEGFILVPEGNGGVINFNNGKNRQNPYYTQVYGWDYGEERAFLTGETASAIPVFGISKNGSSMLCILEDYATVATIEADVSGRGHGYNIAYATYTTLHDAQLKVSDKTDKAVIVFENEKPTGQLSQRYRFLDNDTYSEMASSYRDYLMEQYPSLVKKEESSIPFNVSLIGSVDKVEQRLGVPVSVPHILTSYEEANDIIKELKDNGYDNLSIRYRGWSNNGIKNNALNKIKHISQLGSKKELKELINYCNDNDISLYLEGRVQSVYNDGLFDGFTTNSKAAKYSSREIIKLYDFSEVYYGPDSTKDNYFFVRPEVTLEYMKTLSEYAKKNSVGVAFSDVGDILGANYDPKHLTNREDVMKLHQEELARIASEGTDIMIKFGNYYALPYADFISDMDLKGSKYQIIDYLVPFYSMAIHGLVDYTGTPINISSDYEEQVLKAIETGAGLSFLFMDESTSALVNTNYTHFYAANYDMWKDIVKEIYNKYQESLGHVFNQYMTEHQQLADGVYVTGYEDGTKVYVNYNYYDFEQDNITVPARDYIVKGR